MRVKEIIETIMVCLYAPLLIPHYIVYCLSPSKVRCFIDSDVCEMNRRLNESRGLLYYLALHKPYRNLFYYRIGRIKSLPLKFYMREYSLFKIGNSLQYWGKYAFVLNHPYGTIINAKYIGDNFTICQLTTLGNKMHGYNDLIPRIGNNVSLGSNVNILGNIKIGDNVVIGAGSVIVKDIPNNSVVAGNPGEVIKPYEYIK